MPIRGDKLYRVWNGTLEEATFISEGLADPSCRAVTWRVRHGGEHFRVATDFYETTKLVAYEEYFKMLQESVPVLKQHLAEVAAQCHYVVSEIVKTHEILQQLKKTASKP